MNSSLIDRLYSTFKRYPLKDKIDTCPDCDLDDEEVRLHLKPLSELSSKDLSSYTFKAITTFGDIEDFKHFVPRVFELLVTNNTDSEIDIDFVFSKLKLADISNWPADEYKAIRDLVNEWYNSLRNSNHEDEFSWLTDEIAEALNTHGFEDWI